MSGGQTGQVTGTKDKEYNILWFTEACLTNVLRLETYIQDAEGDGDQEVVDSFRRVDREPQGSRAGQGTISLAGIA